MDLSPRRLTLDDVAAGQELSGEAGWNQTAEDWAIFLGHGSVLGCRDPAGALVATAAALPYDGFGFVAMVLVTPAWQKRGLATRLVEQAIAALRDQNLIPALDATPAGAAVYGRLGFVPLFDLCRWERTAPAPATTADQSAIAPAGLRDLDRLAALDAAAFGSRRRFLIEAFLRRADTRAFAADDAFIVARRGSRATQLGPLVAGSEAQAITLLNAALAESDGPVFLDVAERCTDITDWLAARGFRRQRPFARMALGRAEPFGDPARLMVSAGPEFG